MVSDTTGKTGWQVRKDTSAMHQMGRKLSSGEPEICPDAYQSVLGVKHQAINHLLSVNLWTLVWKTFSLVIWFLCFALKAVIVLVGCEFPVFSWEISSKKQQAHKEQELKQLRPWTCVVDRFVCCSPGTEQEAPEVNDLQVIRGFSRARSRSCWAWPCWPSAISCS